TQGQIQITIAEKESSGNTNGTISLKCNITNLTDSHLKCEHIWWVQEKNQDTHEEEFLGIIKQPSYQQGYCTKLNITDNGRVQVVSCKALCNFQTFTSTCHLPAKRGTAVECSVKLFATSGEVGQLPNTERELENLKTILNIIVFIMCMLSVIVIAILINCVYKKFQKKGTRKYSMADITDNENLEMNKFIGEEELISERKSHNIPSILLNGELLLEGDTPFAKVTYKSDKPVISYVNNTDALQNWDPGVSCFTLDASDTDSSEEYIEKKHNQLYPNDCYEWNHSASCPEVHKRIS
ncbi:uncharacterized protein LOC115209176, partial [Argonauta hians]